MAVVLDLVSKIFTFLVANTTWLQELMSMIESMVARCAIIKHKMTLRLGGQFDLQVYFIINLGVFLSWLVCNFTLQKGSDPKDSWDK